MKKRIEVGRLRLGMFVCGIDRGWMDTPFVRHKFLLRSREQLEQLRGCCREVTIDTDRGCDVSPPPVAAPVANDQPVAAPPAVVPVPVVATEPPLVPASEEESRALERELARAAVAHREANGVLERVLDDVRLGRSIDSNKSRRVVKELTESVVRNPNALLCLTQLKDRDLYTSQHSVNVCIFTLAFARHIGVPKTKMEALGLGALLHDIGKMRVSLEVLNKPGPLTDEEFTEMKRHPELSLEILDRQEGIHEITRDVVHSHHERIDGGGYPRGLKGREISLYARMVAIVDVYDAITSARVYHDPVSPLVALQRLYQWRYKDFDNRLVEKFIQCLGVYPAGSLVELNSGEVGVVVKVNAEDRPRPVVKLLLDRAGRPRDEAPLLDLSRPPATGVRPAIAKVLDPLDWQESLGGLWNPGLEAAG